MMTDFKSVLCTIRYQLSSDDGDSKPRKLALLFPEVPDKRTARSQVAAYLNKPIKQIRKVISVTPVATTD